MNHSDLTVSESGVLLHGTKLDLSKKELALLRVLAADPTRVFTKAELMRTIWNLAAFGGTRTLDRCARRLRRKLNADGGRYIVDLWGVGYRLLDTTNEAADA